MSVTPIKPEKKEAVRISAGGVKKMRNVGLKVVTANDLFTGAVIYHTGEAWTEHLATAKIVEGDAALELLELASADEARSVGPYLMDVAEQGGRAAPAGRAKLRETIRREGPTIHPEFQRQEEAA